MYYNNERRAPFIIFNHGKSKYKIYIITKKKCVFSFFSLYFLSYNKFMMKFKFNK